MIHFKRREEAEETAPDPQLRAVANSCTRNTNVASLLIYDIWGLFKDYLAHHFWALWGKLLRDLYDLHVQKLAKKSR